ncbi:Hypothetical protein CINCED_3A009116 [Cinara cedri]|nr:Hypothetical protein CINCED_3A009116 [Cinara cedri]
MGIQGLLPLLEKSWKSVNISQYSGCTVAIDAYSWLHKGVYTCAEKLARGEDCQAYVYYCMRFVSMLLAKNIKPILVFDGQHLPAKADTELKRRKLREQNRKKAAELLRLDKGKEASVLLRRSIDVTHKMALNLIKKCREINVDCIVAPYEADSQLAYLNLSGIAHIVITEDSDLLLFGCKRVLFKMDQNGFGVLIEQDKIYLSMNMNPEQFSLDKFRYMCILSGCDYLPSIHGVGLIKARQFISRSSEPDIYKNLLRLGSFMNVKVPSEYRDKFMVADRMFLYQPVYDPCSRKTIPLNEILDPNLSVLVSKLTDDQAYQLALGNIDPISLEVLDNWDPDYNISSDKTGKKKIIRAHHKSIWSKDYYPNKYEPNNVILSQPIIKSTPPSKKLNVTKTHTKTSVVETPTIKKCLPVTEDDILDTLDEIYKNEEISLENEIDIKDKHQLNKSKINENVLTPDFDNLASEIPTEFTEFSELTKRKSTVLNFEKQIVSGYFSPKTQTSSEIIQKEWINPFKCRKISSPKNENDNDDLSTSLKSNDFADEIELQCHKAEIINMKSNKKLPDTTNKAFNWTNYEKNVSIVINGIHDKKDMKIITQNNSFPLSDDNNKTDNESDIDEGFCSQNIMESNSSNLTPKQSNRVYMRTGLSKSTGKKSQSLLSKFGFKSAEKLKR